VVSSKQRQRQLARAKWERQQQRRASYTQRQRRVSLVVGVILGLIVVGLIGWLVLHIIDQENSRDDQTPSVPTDSFSTNLLSPSTPTGSDSTQSGSQQ
jgi:peptidyl-prolyl cis-trans isomerase B (cyclophilin B)